MTLQESPSMPAASVDARGVLPTRSRTARDRRLRRHGTRSACIEHGADVARHPPAVRHGDVAHRIYGWHTVRFVPTQRPVPDPHPDEFYDWMRNWYGNLARGPFVDQIKRGDLIVIDGYELGSTGFIGSNSALSWIAAGAVGVVTNGGARDTDELIKQKTPLLRYISRTTSGPGGARRSSKFR